MPIFLGGCFLSGTWHTIIIGYYAILHDSIVIQAGMEMVEPFNTTIILNGEEARRFREYDNNPWSNENDRSRAAALRARELAKTLKF